MKRKIIFLDIDGMLAEPGKNEPPVSALRAVEQARREGHYVYLCTGRSYGMMVPLLKYGFDGYIASSGGYIVCGERVIYDCPMTEWQKQTAMSILDREGVYRTAECLDGAYMDEGFKELLRERADGRGNSEFLRWREQLEKALNILPMKEYRGQPVYKIGVISLSGEGLEEPGKLLASEFSFCVQDKSEGGFTNGEVLPKTYDKGAAVRKVCGHLHIPVSDSVAFGDSMNDKEMLESAGLNICMEDGSERLKLLADDVCPGVRKDGIWKAFLKHGLIRG